MARQRAASCNSAVTPRIRKRVALAPLDPEKLFIAVQFLLAGYLALSLRRVYSGSWPGTLLKCLFLLAMLLAVFVGLALLAAEVLIWFDPEP